jgi:hypothetical protein
MSSGSNKEIVKIFINNNRFKDIPVDGKVGLKKAYEDAADEDIIKLLENNERFIDIVANHKFKIEFFQAVQENNVRDVKQLMQNPRIANLPLAGHSTYYRPGLNLSVMSIGHAIFYAAMKGYKELMEILLTHPRIMIYLQKDISA